MRIKDDRAVICAALESKLQSTLSPWDRLPILIELTKEPDWKKPEAGFQYAQEALSLALELGDPFWLANSLRTVSITLFRKGDHSTALKKAIEARELFEEIGEKVMKAQTDLIIADIYTIIGQLDDAIRIILPCYYFFEDLNDPLWTMWTLRSLGNFYKTIGDHSNAIGNYRQAIAVGKEAGLQRELCPLYLRLAESYRQMGEKNIEGHYLKKSLALAQRTNSVQGLAWTISGLASFYVSIDEFARAEKYVKLSMKFSGAMGNLGYQGIAWGMMATIAIDKEEYGKALQYFRKGLTFTRQAQDPLFRGLLYQKLGELYMQLGNNERGLTYLKRGLRFIQKSRHTFYLFQTHERLAKACEQAGDTAGAVHHFKQFSSIKHDHLNSQKLLETNRIDTQRKLQKVTKQLERERSKNRTLAEWIEQKEAELVALTQRFVHRPKSDKQKNEATLTTAKNSQNSSMVLPENWEIFARQFHKVHHSFYPKLVGQYPDLTPTEIKVCSLIRIGLSSKEIADILSIAKRTVDNHRANVHKKMNLEQGASLTGFIAQI